MLIYLLDHNNPRVQIAIYPSLDGQLVHIFNNIIFHSRLLKPNNSFLIQSTKLIE